MRVLQIIDSLNVGGAEVLSVNMANALHDKGIESYLFTTRLEGPLKDNLKEEVHYLFLNRKGLIGFKALTKAYKYILANQITVLHAHSTSIVFATFLRILLGKRVKFIWHVHSGKYIHLKGLKMLIFRLCSLKMHTIVSVNQQLLQWSKKLHAKNQIMLRNFPFFTNLDEITTLKGNPSKRIVCLASLREEKSHMTLLRAFKNVIEEYPEWTLHLVGKTYQDDYFFTLKEYIDDNHLSKHVFFCGICTDIKHILSQSTIGVLSSKSEGLPVSLLEYGLAKLPVVTTDVGECGKLIQDKNVLVEPENSKEFSRALSYLIKDKDMRRTIAEELAELVKREYNIDSFTNELKEIYNK